MNVGIIGLGFMGATHAVSYTHIPGARIAAVCARDNRHLTGKFSAQSGNLGITLPDIDLTGAAKYNDWRQLVADPQVHAVDICGPSDLHQEMTITALQHGKHVLCEKPMALTFEACNRMLHAAATADRRLMIAHVLRFWPAYEYLRDWLRACNPGLKRARFQRQCAIPDWSCWQTDEHRSGGALLDLLIHDIDQILLLFGWPETICARPLDSCDSIRATMRYPNGFMVRLEGGWMQAGTPFSMGFHVQTHDAAIQFEENALAVTGAASAEQVELPSDDPFQKELSYFLHCCSSGQAPAICPPAESRAAVKLALLLKQSQSSGGIEIACER